MTVFRQPNPNQILHDLTTAEILLRNRLNKADATPFIAHCEVDEPDRVRFLSAFKLFLSERPERFLDAFRNYPAVSQVERHRGAV